MVPKKLDGLHHYGGHLDLMRKHDGTKHPTDGHAKHMPHLSKVHKAAKSGFVETPQIKIGHGSAKAHLGKKY